MTLHTLLVLRFTIAALFLWFGLQQLGDPGVWVGFLPEWTGYFPVPGEMLVQLNGWFEVVFAIMLVAGIFTRAVAAVLGMHLLGIAVAVGGAIGVRDAALALVTLALALSPVDAWTVDKRYFLP